MKNEDEELDILMTVVKKFKEKVWRQNQGKEIKKGKMFQWRNNTCSY